eukprot:g1480.t1
MALERLVEELKDSFTLLGQHDGDEITVDTAYKKLIDLGYEISKEEVRALLKTMSDKGDGERVIFEHCLQSIQEKLNYSDESHTIEDALKVLDKFGTGGISAAELRHLLFCQKEKHGMTVEEIETALKLCGDTKDGRIDTRRLLASMHS